jgi:hypothetical protein
MPSQYYNLDGRVPVNVPFEDWKPPKWDEKQVAQTNVGKYSISTVFLAIDHRREPSLYGSPVLFETLVFYDETTGHMARCSTWEEAEEQHAEMVALYEKILKETA